jgi:hypothetical protein
MRISLGHLEISILFMNKKAQKVYQLKISIDNIRPPVWRRVLVSDRSTLLDLHFVIQAAFDWLGYHLHEFSIGGVTFGDPAIDEFGDFDLQDEAGVRLSRLNLEKGDRFRYQYDFGDSWYHTLLVEQVLPYERGMKLPLCIQGKRARPPEDVGGPWGYQNFLAAIRDPQHEEHAQFMEWIGGAFDPEEFDLEAVNKRLRQSGERYWPGSLPSEEEESLAASVYQTTAPQKTKFLREEHEATAQSLPLRKDVVAFITYLKESKVTGTQSTGNLPRKDVAAVAARFVTPPRLETNIGDTVFQFQSETEVWPIFFVHVLASSAGCISGGTGKRWKVTQLGEIFLTLPAAAQVRLIFTSWWYRANWLIAYHYDIFGGVLPEHLGRTTASLLLKLPADVQQPYEPFADQLIQAVGWTWQKQEPDNTRKILYSAIESMVINPLEQFGILKTDREKDQEQLWAISVLKSFTITPFGQALLKEIETVQSG